NMAASRAAVVGSLFWKCGSCSTGTFLICTNVNTQLLSRQICATPAMRRKNLAAAGPQKFTEEFIKKQVEEFNIGKRHLANMMDEDPQTFTQEDIDRSISYLFPSGLFDKRARPVMKHPDQVFPRQTAVQWGEDGRPFHYLFYTGKQSYYSLMHVSMAVLHSLAGSRWLLKEELEESLVENISDHDFARFIQLIERLVALPYGAAEEEFVLGYRRQLEVQSSKQEIQPLQYDQKGVAYSTADGRRKMSTASVTLKDSGSGKFTINGMDQLHYFPVLQDREQLLFPLHFARMLGRFDVDSSVTGGGRSAQAGALRLAISRALLSFLPEGQVEDMRQAGLLTPDPRVKERKKPGQEGARKKFTWKKR
uniref:Small ribosomal subunit protein uS9m n=1 Tax=Denticeps clupeoides TaxID=299321 RepID=A0AAY4E6P4_9TELE